MPRCIPARANVQCHATVAPVEAAEAKRDSLTAARRAMITEGEAILAAAARLDIRVVEAAQEILKRPGSKTIVTGIGKSGHVARKLTGTLQSTGTPAVFLHASDAMHGDLGLCQPGDPVIMISKSGTSAEMLRLVDPLRAAGSTLIGIVGNPQSPLAREMDLV